MFVTGQTTFSKFAKEAFKFDFESEEAFTFCASPPFNTLSTKNWKILCWKRRQPSSGSRRKRDNFAEKIPSKIGCFQGLWHWGQLTGKSVVMLTLTSKWSMSRSWTQRYFVCADSKFWIRSPEVTQEPWVKFNTSRQFHLLVDGIRVRVGNKKRIRTDCLY